jgi:hypothetical protein
VGASVSHGTSGWRLAVGMPAVCHTRLSRRKRDLTCQSPETYPQHAVAGYGGQPRSCVHAWTCRRTALTADDVRQLTTWVRAGTTPQRLVRRARVVLGSAAGLGSRALARQERMSPTTVRRWLGRFATQRCAGLQDRPRRGRPKSMTPATRALVVALGLRTSR